MSASRPKRAGLIGCGDISPSHLRTYANLGIDLAAVCDLDRSRAERRLAEFNRTGTPIHADSAELLARDDIDFVTVATPVSAHTPLTLAAMRAGKHVACEKPAALSLRELEEVQRVSAETGRRVIYFSSRMRFGPAVLARPYLQRGALGRIYRVDVDFARRRGRPGIDIILDARWFTEFARAGGGVIMDMGQYFMDLVFNLTGWPKIETVSATEFRGFAHSLPEGAIHDVEEQCTILARAQGGVTYTFDFAWIAHRKPRQVIRILGTEGGLELNLTPEPGEQPFTFFHDLDGPWHWMNTTTDWRSKAHGNDEIYRQFVAALDGRDPGVGTTPSEAIAITRLTTLAQQSAREGREVRAES